MNNAKHTPGPWHNDGRYVGSGHAKANICECSDNCGNWSDDAFARANARLIAAAPELLEALQAIVADDEFCGQAWGDRRDAWIATARAAIAKATGSAQ